MPQLSLYIDDKTLKKLETAAKIEKLSISKLAVKKLNETLNQKWPDNYKSLFGSIKDDTFELEKTIDFELDIKREEL